MLIALAQLNPLIGDFKRNIEKMEVFISKARNRGCDLIVFPELSFIGYPPRDLLDQYSFVPHSKTYWSYIEKMSKDIGIICGVITENPDPSGKPYYNSAVFFHNGEIITIANKRLLPFYDVFDEERYFEPGKETCCIEWKNEKLGITICEDIWNKEGILPRKYYPCDPVMDMKENGVSILINIAASPYYMGKVNNVMIPLLKRVARETGAILVHVNQIGGNDELLFQGHSMVCLPNGELAARSLSFDEDLIFFDTETGTGDKKDAPSDDIDEVINALCMGLRDYVSKCGFRRVVIGMSGGIDSAVTACIATMSLGAENVLGVGLPGPYSSRESIEDAFEVSKRLNIEWTVIPIVDLFKSTLQALKPAFEGLEQDVTEENIQARLRGLILMALSNKFGRLLLSTGNKSELAVGYCTLYGDMNGGLAVLGDVPKTLVYKIAARFMEKYNWIPERVITKPPSAELRPNQTDQDTLPPYDVLDRVLEMYIEENKSYGEIMSEGLDPEIVRQVIKMVNRNEYKRRQAPPVLKVTSKAFGTGRRMPIAHGYKPINEGVEEL